MSSPVCCGIFCLAYGELVADNTLTQGIGRHGVINAQQAAGVPGAEQPSLNVGPCTRAQLEQAQCVGYGRAAFAKARCQFFLREFKRVAQCLKSFCFLDRKSVV